MQAMPIDGHELTPGARLKRIRELHGFSTAKAAALHMQIPIATYTQHEQTDKMLPARRASEYARFFGTTPEYILYGRGASQPERVPVLNCQGEPTTRSAVMPAAPSAVTLAQQAVDGDGIAHFGFVALYDMPQTKATPPDVDGRLCVVSPSTGEHRNQRLIRIVRLGSKPDRFHLISTGGGLPLVDQQLAWIAPVIALVPATCG